MRLRRSESGEYLVDSLERVATRLEPERTHDPHEDAELLAEEARARRGLRAEARTTVVLAREERRTRIVVALCAALFALEAGGSLSLLAVQVPGVGAAAVNSAAKGVVFAVVCGLVAADVPRFGRLLTLVVLGELALVVGLLVPLAAGDRLLPREAGASDAATLLGWAWLLLSLAIAAALALAQRVAGRSRYGLAYLSSLEFETLEALAEVAVELATLDGEEVARNVDDYLANIRSDRAPTRARQTREGKDHRGGGRRSSSPEKASVRTALILLGLRPLLSLKPPFPLLSPSDRLQLLHRLEGVSDGPSSRRFGALVARVARQLVYLGFYGDARTYPLVGYAPPKLKLGGEGARADSRERVARIPPPSVSADAIQTEVAIVGSGAAASVMAYELASQGRQVLLLERGRQVEPDELGADELYRRATLYADGGLPSIVNPRFAAVAASCVGGNTNLSTGPLIAPPAPTLKRWAEMRAAPELELVEQGVRKVSELLASQRVPESVTELRQNRLAHVLGTEAQLLFPAGENQLMNWSTLQTLLARAQQRFGEQFVVLSECRAEEIHLRDRRAQAVRSRLGDGRRLHIYADQVIVAAGAPESSALLQRSGVNGPVGHGLSFYLGSRVVGDFPLPVRSGESGSTSWTVDARLPGEGLVLRSEETSPAVDALLTPAPVGEHRRTMLRHPHLAAVSALIGTRATGRVGKSFFGRPALHFTLAEEDARRLRAGVRLAARALLAAGAQRVIPATTRYMEHRSEDDLERFEWERGPELAITTAYPLGGNPLNADPGKGVVDPSLRVHGHENIFVCDASVLPTSLPVEPQLTVMALAYVAAQSLR